MTMTSVEMEQEKVKRADIESVRAELERLAAIQHEIAWTGTPPPSEREHRLWAYLHGAFEKMTIALALEDGCCVECLGKGYIYVHQPDALWTDVAETEPCPSCQSAPA